MLRNKIQYLRLALWLVVSADGANILGVFPLLGTSRYAFNKSIMDALFDAGHNVTMVISAVEQNVNPNYTIMRVSYSLNQYFSTSSKPLEQLSPMELIDTSTSMISHMCEETMKSSVVQDLMNSRDRKFDVIFTEAMCILKCFTVIGDRLGIPIIETIAQKSDRMADLSIGNYYNSAFIENEKFKIAQTDATFFWRLINLWNCFLIDKFYYLTATKELEKLYRIHGENYNPMDVNENKISLMFINSHSSILSRPLLPNVIEVAGIHVKPAKPLSQDFQQILNSAKNGVVLFSLGSALNSKNIDQNLIAAFKNAFAETPQTVLWKWNDTIDGLSNNVLTIDWIPQRDILDHKNVQVFITHCGISGIYEAIVTAKPLIMLPFFVDQFANCASLEKMGVGIQLDKSTVTKEHILRAIDVIINGTSYKHNMQKLSNKFKDRPMTPKESVIFWTEYVIKHKGTSHLKTTDSEIPLYQFLLLDISLFLIISAVITVSIVSCYFKQFITKYLTSYK